MIKVPATKDGIPALEALIAKGINVNSTLIFSLSQYESVARAYISGLQDNSQPGRVASVASFFVSRIDTAVDKLLEKNGSKESLALLGKIAVSYTKMIYQRFNEIFLTTLCPAAGSGSPRAAACLGQYGNQESPILGCSLCRRDHWSGHH
jgi:transaldolase